jgi:hypothetical protein
MTTQIRHDNVASMVKRLLVLALVTSCGKKTEAPPAPPPAEGSAAPAAADTRPAGEAAAPAAAPVAIDAAVPDAAVTIDAAAAAAGDPPNHEQTLCPKVLPRIVECQKDADFIAALNAGADRKQKKIIASLLREVADWPENMKCSDLAPAYQYGGFIYHWDKFAAFPDALDSCAKLGVAIQAAGGLFGGEQGE